MKFLIKLVCLFVPGPWRKDARMRLTGLVMSIPVRARAARVGAGFCALGAIKVTRRTYIGDDVSINNLKVEGDGKCIFGNHVHTGREMLVITSNHDYRGDFLPYGPDAVCKDVEIGDFVWVGTRVTILPGTKIGEGSIIQAGAVVHGVIPPCSIVGGNPAVVFAKRDERRYEDLKRQGAIYSAYAKCSVRGTHQTEAK